MSDVATQLREYFDDVTERMTEEDVRLRADIARGMSRPPARFRPRPMAAGAIGFGLAMTLIGTVVVMNRLTGGSATDVGGPGPSGPALSDGGSWLILPVVVGFGLLATGIIATLRNTRMTTRGGHTMQTIEREEPTLEVDDEILHLRKRNRWLGWLAGILAVAVIGLGAWLIVELTSSDGASLPAEAEEALDGYVAGWNAHDGSAAISFTTDDFTMVSGGQVFPRCYVAGTILASPQITVETTDQIVTGDGPYYVARTERAVGTEGISVFTIVEVDGTWKIQRHQYAGPL